MRLSTAPCSSGRRPLEPGAPAHRRRRGRSGLGGPGRAQDPPPASRGSYRSGQGGASPSQAPPGPPARRWGRLRPPPFSMGSLRGATGFSHRRPGVPPSCPRPCSLSGAEAETAPFTPPSLPPSLLQAVLPGRHLLPHTAAEATGGGGGSRARAGLPVTWPWASLLLGARAWLPVAMGTAEGTLGAVVSGTVPDGNGRSPLPSGPVPRLRPAFPPGTGTGAGGGMAALFSPQRSPLPAAGGSFCGGCPRCGGLSRLGGPRPPRP